MRPGLFGAIVIAPLLVLADQSIAYAVVGWGCTHQHPGAVASVHIAFLVATALASLPAWLPGARRAAANEVADPAGAMLARVGAWLGALSCLVIAAMALVQGWLAPCIG